MKVRAKVMARVTLCLMVTLVVAAVDRFAGEYMKLILFFYSAVWPDANNGEAYNSIRKCRHASIFRSRAKIASGSESSNGTPELSRQQVSYSWLLECWISVYIELPDLRSCRTSHFDPRSFNRAQGTCLVAANVVLFLNEVYIVPVTGILGLVQFRTLP